MLLRLTRCIGNTLASPVVVDCKGATILFNGGRGVETCDLDFIFTIL